MAEIARRVALAGCTNFRDVGGYEVADGRRVRSGRLFRSDGLHVLTAEDVELLHGRRIRTVFDLRMPEEIDRFGTGALFAGEGAPRLVRVPLFETVPERWLADMSPHDAERIAREYFEMLSLGRPSVVRLFRDLAAESTYPAVFHCMAGKDRTGTVAAILLSVLGVAPDVIGADYLLTAESFPDAPLFAETMQLLLQRVEQEHGSSTGYLRAAGVTDAELECVRAALLEP